MPGITKRRVKVTNVPCKPKGEDIPARDKPSPTEAEEMIIETINNLARCWPSRSFGNRVLSGKCE
jgi:hypothetical protein